LLLVKMLGTFHLWSSYRVYVNFRILDYAALPLLGALLFAQQSSMTPLIVRDVTIIDCAGHAARPGMSLLISNGHIAGIGTAARVKAPANAEYSTAAGNI
jgi:hypothetical protein